jgi:hypothetical protein
MAACFTATYKNAAPDFFPVGWEDCKGLHLGSVELFEARSYSRAIAEHQTITAPTQSLEAWLSSLPNLQGVRLRNLFLGEYYPRIHRPCSTSFPYEIPTYPEITETSAVAVDVLIERMDHLFRVIEPDTANTNAYGHEIRNLLLLASMEVEAAWAAVLRANNYPNANRKWTTTDYIKLLNPLHLSEYELKLTSYPKVPPLTPFATWATSQPTQSLAWYHAYNQTKHDREQAFAAATLKHAINAVAAAVILFYAQFGQTYYEYELDEPKMRFRQFHVTRWPVFPQEEWYLIQAESVSWTPTNYPL